MAADRRELPIPPAVASNQNSAEVTRVWITQGAGMDVSLRDDLFKDYAMWGLILVDLARHVANARFQRSGVAIEETLARIRQGLDAEWRYPTDEATGNVMN